LLEFWRTAAQKKRSATQRWHEEAKRAWRNSINANHAYDFNVWTTKKRGEKLRYMHRNPVKRGLVGVPE
jgi:hypothetical protein